MIKEIKWYKSINRSLLTPPDWVFSVVWTILYILIVISLIIYVRNRWTKYGLILFVIQLVLNIIWTTIFFKYKLICWSVIDIILLIIVVMMMIKEFYRVNRYSGYILVPYIVWLIFALYLNIYICLYN